MTTTLTHELFPAIDTGWIVSRVKIDRRWSVTARRPRGGVTYIYRQLAGGGWNAAKLKGGQVLEERDVLHLPQHIINVIVPPKSGGRK